MFLEVYDNATIVMAANNSSLIRYGMVRLLIIGLWLQNVEKLMTFT